MTFNELTCVLPRDESPGGWLRAVSGLFDEGLALLEDFAAESLDTVTDIDRGLIYAAGLTGALRDRVAAQATRLGIDLQYAADLALHLGAQRRLDALLHDFRGV